jgi:hypothetical protein
MTGLLLIQSFTGWCWQCPRDEAGESSGSDTKMACEDYDDHCPDVPDGDCPDEPCKCPLECQGFCTYLPVEKSQIDSPYLIVPLELATLHLSACSLQLGQISWERARDPIVWEPPLRLHLLHQIMLI